MIPLMLSWLRRCLILMLQSRWIVGTCTQSWLNRAQIAAVMNLSRWSTHYAVWSFVMGRTKPESNQYAAMEWGHRLDGVIADKYSEQLKVKLAQSPTLQSQQYLSLVGSVDRLVLNEQGEPVKVLQINTTTMNHNSGDKDDLGLDIKEWGPGNQYSLDGRLLIQDSQVPLQYILQIMHCLILTGLKQSDIAVLMSGNDFRVYTIDFDEELASQMIQTADRFWCHNVLDAIIPPLKEVDAKTHTPVLMSTAQATSTIVKTIEEFKLRNQELNELKDIDQEL